MWNIRYYENTILLWLFSLEQNSEHNYYIIFSFLSCYITIRKYRQRQQVTTKDTAFFLQLQQFATQKWKMTFLNSKGMTTRVAWWSFTFKRYSLHFHWWNLSRRRSLLFKNDYIFLWDHDQETRTPIIGVHIDVIETRKKR